MEFCKGLTKIQRGNAEKINARIKYKNKKYVSKQSIAIGKHEKKLKGQLMTLQKAVINSRSRVGRNSNI